MSIKYTHLSIPKIENAKEFLDAISKKYPKFSKNEKNELSDNHWVNFCFEYNIIDVSFDSWWLDSGDIIHTCNFMQVVISRRSPTSLEQYVYMGDVQKSKLIFWELLDCNLVQEIFWNYRM